MPTININDKQVTVEKGTTIIQAAARLGVEIPHYCYHPGLSIAGNCRMCLVEVEKMPKLQIACHIQCADGMTVRTETEKVKKTRQHILEFLLVNHPLDCPVCDQAGECRLQDYYMDHGLYESRLNEEKVKKKKAVPIGPHVILDSERCILCSRCIRFCDEVTKTNEFGIFNRGDHSEIGLYPGKELTNDYSGNVVDICPVGALTDRDFRFKCRVWYLKKTESICNGCSRGCNITIEANTERPQHGRGERVMRIKPRFQPAVNQWWICDHGRFEYKWIDHNRILEPTRREQGIPEPIHWNDALNEIAHWIHLATHESPKEFAVFLSPQMSNENLYLARKLFKESLHLEHVYLLPQNPNGSQDDLLIRSDKHPNRKGAELLGFIEDKELLQEVINRICQGKVKGAYFFGQDAVSFFNRSDLGNALSNLELSVFHGTNHNLTSEVVRYNLASAAYAETNGSFTNFEGKVQKFFQALLPLQDSRSDFDILCALAERLGIKWHYSCEDDVFGEIELQLSAFRNVIEAAQDPAAFLQMESK